MKEYLIVVIGVVTALPASDRGCVKTQETEISAHILPGQAWLGGVIAKLSRKSAPTGQSVAPDFG